MDIKAITLADYIKKLQAIEKEYGGDIPVMIYEREYDGYGDMWEIASEPTIEKNIRYYYDVSDVKNAGFHSWSFGEPNTAQIWEHGNNFVEYPVCIRII